MIKLKDLKPNPKNPRIISEDQLEKLKNSIKRDPEFMKLRPIVHDGGMILGGNMRYRACLALGKKEVPNSWVKDASDLTDEQKRRFIVVDNAPDGMTGDWDWEELSDEFDMEELADWGFSADELEKSFGGFELESDQDAEPQIDKAEELREKWQVETGQLWQLGEHRLLCGDSTNAKDVARVMGSDKHGVLVFSDPPYGFDVVSKSGKMGGGGAPKFGTIGGGGVVKPTWYSSVIGDSNTDTSKAFFNVCLEFGFTDFIIWGGNYFTDFLPPSRCWLVWNKENTGNFADAELAWTSFKTGVVSYNWIWNGMVRKGDKKTEGKKRVHPTQKPVGLHIEILKDKEEFNIVFDGFLGSGTTLLACEQLNRKCRAIEISAEYCAVALQRFFDATGITPELDKNNRPSSDL